MKHLISTQYAFFNFLKTTTNRQIDRFLLISFLVSFVTACQTVPKKELTAPVLPVGDNTFETSGEGIDKKSALADAMYNATLTCSNSSNKLRPLVMSHDVKYAGLIDEKTDQMINKVGKIIGVFAGKPIPSTRDKTDFQANLTFKCIN